MAFIGVLKTTIMNFKFLIISIVIMSGFAGSAFAQQNVQLAPQEFSQEEIDEMKNKAVLITMHEGTFTIEFFPEDAPNTVHHFLKLVESGYYDGIVFHRIIPGFMIQTGDPNTKDPDADRSLWGTGGPGYQINAEFNTIQHDRGIVSMARSNHVDTAGSQFFIVHKDSNFLDGQYTVFGRLIPGMPQYLDELAALETDGNDAPLDLLKSTIITAEVLDPYTSSGLVPPERNQSNIEKQQRSAGVVEVYTNSLHKVEFDIPYRWTVTEAEGKQLGVILEPNALEHNVKAQIEKSGFIPKVIITAEPRDPREDAGISTAFFSVQGGDDPKILSNYVFESEDGRKAHLITTTQDLQTSTETTEFKIVQLTFIDSESQYSIIYVNVTEWFRYEIHAFLTTAENFKIMIDGKLQPIDFADSPVFKQVIADAKAKPEPEPLPLARIGGCLIATATYGSELAPQVQLLREIRDNTVLQTQSGTSFMTAFNQFYYSFSPAIADYERENTVFKETVKLTLTPLLASLTLLQYADIDSEHDMLGYGIGIILLNIGMYFIAPALLITKIRSFYKLQ
uniref:peptidylprolyl isomerase n=1 Tax=uncultured marine thaumarchaeote AD1000_04_C02 TaxID=1455881 RepID=A0A075FM08_9ARCH|nr:peptidyl-prolyl isomerase (PPIB, ppiB) [uncultured marine thaumarchaeote AD1000_04_C02]